MPFGMSLGFKTAKAGALSATPDLGRFRAERISIWEENKNA
jgi:hypothetical protein